LRFSNDKPAQIIVEYLDMRLKQFVRQQIATLFVVALASGAAGAQEDHSSHQMDHSGHDGAHEITDEMLVVLRERIPLYREYNVQQIQLEMQMMGPNEMRYLSAGGVKGEVGVLVLIHGFGTTGNRIMQESVEPLGQIFPTAMGAGMAMMSSDHIQQAVDKLTAAGAKRIVVVPMVSSEANTLKYQWDHALGFRDAGAYLDIPRVKTDAEIIVTDPPAEHPLINEIIFDHTMALSEDPANEAVFVLAHGPIHEDENRRQLEAMQRQAQRIQELGGFYSVEGITLQDDGASAVRARNVEALRAKIEAASAEGKTVLIVTSLLAARSIQWKIERDLKGLDYKFSVDGISVHENFGSWFRETVMSAVR
jgi:sirohydrochlorin ferrochelatase